ncbi:MAG: esterase [Pseudomonadales bacterium]|nr:esterase [Pseudomonadales bacterium]MDP6471069.1 esterase [Pseudomonadales bacterium]MDP6825745.1 esterase [Pseudomonadales bacterium]MDP6970716.1 esterase [Pseudomonadales bacterium]
MSGTLEVSTEHQPPAMLNFAAELPRTLAEAASLPLTWMSLLWQAPRGDGHPVMVLPGFTAGDTSTLMLRRFLDQLGYHCIPWGLGQNTGNPDQLLRLEDRFQRLVDEHGEPISLIGQSLGGVYSRGLAREWPERVRQVITLGSPFAIQEAGAVNSVVQALFKQMSGTDIEQMKEHLADRLHGLPLDVPSTSIYSRSDGVVGWRACVEPENEQAQNIEIVGSHSGMAINPVVLHILANRLAQHPKQWAKFDSGHGCMRWILPRQDAT